MIENKKQNDEGTIRTNATQVSFEVLRTRTRPRFKTRLEVEPPFTRHLGVAVSTT